MDIFFGDGGGPYIPDFDPEWMFDIEEDPMQREALDDALRDNEDLVEDIASSQEPQKIPLASRHAQEKKGSPFMRWAVQVATGQKKCTDPLEYTEEELDAKLQDELKDDIERF